MRCPKCGGANEAGSRFCGVCGASLAVARPVTPAAPAPVRVYCQRCGTPNPAGSKFCEGCGSAMGAPAAQPATPAGAVPAKPAAGKPPGALWVLPVLFGWLGGIIAWAAATGTNPSTARKMLALGFLVTLIWVGVVIVLDMAESGFSFSDFSFE
ncbi:Double zinc ribbon [Dehalogenimonas alkenigignens]|uniref:Double zinc ribbon n=1 Tax=Dehalogenimonas alkenigignens TaxID=1217799 RepID=A0A0W0GG49_9CHLR|nr:zinc ribbon domain-containing protein [Dehalogenimonas alkenigignens]KTB47539.1 Double zinc ribbon [Dehalogenimonas alkenigignens]